MSRAVLLAVLIAGDARAAGPDRVAYPAGFETGFLRYNIVDRPDRKRARLMYVDRATAAAAKPGEPIPEGAVIVMEDREVELDPAGAPVLDADGRLKPTSRTTAVFVMEKRKGWGETVGLPPEKRNGDWDYAAFRPDGAVNADARLEACFACHQARKSRDFTFTLFRNVADGLAR